MTPSDDALSDRLQRKPGEHAKLLNAQYLVPDEAGLWTVTFDFAVEPHDIQRMAKYLETIPGLEVAAEREKTLKFSLDCSGSSDPERTIDQVCRKLHVAKRDHIIAVQQLDPDGMKATVQLQFWRGRTEGELLDLTNRLALRNGVIDAHSTDEGDIVLELNSHYASEYGVRRFLGGVAHTVRAHILRIDTDDTLVPLKEARQMIGGLMAGVPAVPAPKPLPAPAFTALGNTNKPQRRVRRATLLCRSRGYRTTSV